MRRAFLMMGAIVLAGWVSAVGLDAVVAPGTVAEKLAGGFKFTEGATVNRAGEVFFVDQPNNQILRWTREDGLRVFMAPSGYANGMCFAPDGKLLVCADERTELWAVAEDGSKTTLCSSFEGRRFNGPNDVWACPQGGGCYLTDPFYKRKWWDYSEQPQATEQVYFLPKGGQPRRVTDDLVKPNGIVGTADGKQLYVADIRDKKTWLYDTQPDGTLTNKRLFCEMGSDGMTLDADGRVYLTGVGVYVFDKNGVKLGVIEIPERWCGNVCIGGPKKDTLFVTASTGLYAVPLRVKGMAGGK